MDILRKVIASLITLYQKSLSPDHGYLKMFYPYGFCRHSPTCSEFAKEAILTQGIVRGTLQSLKRFLQCNPWTKLSDEKLRERICASK